MMLTPEQHNNHFNLHARAERLLKDIQNAGDKLGGVAYSPDTETEREGLAKAAKALSDARFALIDTWDVTQVVGRTYKPRK
jgi:hypothetical protein